MQTLAVASNTGCIGIHVPSLPPAALHTLQSGSCCYFCTVSERPPILSLQGMKPGQTEGILTDAEMCLFAGTHGTGAFCTTSFYLSLGCTVW